ncbi:MAG: flavodoxin FldA [Bacteroides sp.]|nr:flavodoxin FldA [Bacteroides sp.]
MKRTGVFYGSTTGATEEVAGKIASRLGVDEGDVVDVANLTEDIVAQYEVLILGSSTWGDGDLQDDWYTGLVILRGMDLSGKKVALFGCGDSESYPNQFVDAIGILYEGLQDTGCTFFGAVDTKDYPFSDSKAVVNGKFVGLPVDEINELEKTDERIDRWVASLKEEI